MSTRRTLVCHGVFDDGEAYIRLKGGVTGKLSELCIKGKSTMEALGHAAMIIRNMRREKKIFPLHEFKGLPEPFLLDHWTRNLGMSFSLWRGHADQLFTLLTPRIDAHNFEVDDFLEEILAVATMMSISSSCSGIAEGFVLYDVTRVTEDALEVIFLHKGHSISNIGYVGTGRTLGEALSGVSAIIPSSKRSHR